MFRQSSHSRLTIFIFVAAFLLLAGCGRCWAQCRDPWVSQAVREVMNRPAQGQGDQGECNFRNYGGGHWTNYADLKQKVIAVFNGVCRDSWVGQAINEAMHRRPQGYGDTGECSPQNYGGGHWSSYPDLRQKVQQHFGVGLPAQTTTPVVQSGVDPTVEANASCNLILGQGCPADLLAQLRPLGNRIPMETALRNDIANSPVIKDTVINRAIALTFGGQGQICTEAWNVLRSSFTTNANNMPGNYWNSFQQLYYAANGNPPFIRSVASTRCVAPRNQQAGQPQGPKAEQYCQQYVGRACATAIATLNGLIANRQLSPSVLAGGMTETTLNNLLASKAWKDYIISNVYADTLRRAPAPYELSRWEQDGAWRTYQDLKGRVGGITTAGSSQPNSTVDLNKWHADMTSACDEVLGQYCPSRSMWDDMQSRRLMTVPAMISQYLLPMMNQSLALRQTAITNAYVNQLRRNPTYQEAQNWMATWNGNVNGQNAPGAAWATYSQLAAKVRANPNAAGRQPAQTPPAQYASAQEISNAVAKIYGPAASPSLFAQFSNVPKASIEGTVRGSLRNHQNLLPTIAGGSFVRVFNRQANGADLGRIVPYYLRGWSGMDDLMPWLQAHASWFPAPVVVTNRPATLPNLTVTRQNIAASALTGGSLASGVISSTRTVTYILNGHALNPNRLLDAQGHVVSHDGGTLTSSTYMVNGHGLIVDRRTGAPLTVSYVVASGAGNVVASGAGNLVAAGAGNVVGPGGSSLMPLLAAGGLAVVNSQMAASLIDRNAAGLASTNGGNLITDNGGALVSNAGGTALSNASNLVASGGGNVIASGAGNLVASGGGNYHTLSVESGPSSNPQDRPSIIRVSYERAFGREPSAGPRSETAYWLSLPASDPRIRSVDALIQNHRAYLRSTPAARSALIGLVISQVFGRPANSADISFWDPQVANGAIYEQLLPVVRNYKAQHPGMR